VPAVYLWPDNHLKLIALELRAKYARQIFDCGLVNLIIVD